jgi:hypothetical protein
MRRAALSLISALLLASTGAAGAAPLVLDGAGGADRLAAAMTRYAGASQVTWVVSVADPAERARLLKDVADRLAETDPSLVERVRAETAARGAPTTAWIEAAPAPQGSCSWQVTLTDPAAPSPGDAPVAIPLAKGDRVPTTASATFVVGFSGPLQSTLYAFAETAPGAIRDLAAAPEFAIPVEASGEETLVLVRARKPVPYLDGLKTELAAVPGARGDLGEPNGLVQRFASRSRGIGALIQLMDPKMVVAQADVPAPQPEPQPEVPVAAADLIETCLYTLTPSAGM